VVYLTSPGGGQVLERKTHLPDSERQGCDRKFINVSAGCRLHSTCQARQQFYPMPEIANDVVEKEENR